MIKSLPKIIKKPWGQEEIWAETNNYVGKIIIINSNSRLSLQYHREKEETIRVISGTLYLYYEEPHKGVVQRILKDDDVVHIPPMTIHRFEAKDEKVTLIEVSTTQIMDVVRIEDDYNRN